MLRAAHQKWLSLGMVVRSDRLERTYPWLLSRELVHAGSKAVDQAGIRRLIQTLPAASTLEGLAEVLLGTVADTTGAARALLLIGDGERLAVRAVRESGATTMVDGSWRTSRTTVRSCERGRRRSAAVVTDRSGPWYGYPEGRPGPTVSATLAVPVRMRDRTIGVVYAEHHGRRRPSTPSTRRRWSRSAPRPPRRCGAWSSRESCRRSRSSGRRWWTSSRGSSPASCCASSTSTTSAASGGATGSSGEMTVLISDIRGYTALLEDMSVSDASDMAIGFLQAVEIPIVANNGLSPGRARGRGARRVRSGTGRRVRAGLAMLRSLREHNRERVARGAGELQVGIGVNSGPVALGLVGGVNRMALTVIGDAVNLASRVESTNKRYGTSLLISEETHARLLDPDRFCIRRMERTPVVNRRQLVTIYEVYDEDPEPLRAAKQAAQPAFDEAFGWLDDGDIERARAAFERCRELLPDDLVAPLQPEALRRPRPRGASPDPELLPNRPCPGDLGRWAS